jgi:RHH-type proline utilization regulon transcriptional repressor/proline dehydrogenase/delta 1-pyrroline-5-carboxylate dehydrogenase
MDNLSNETRSGLFAAFAPPIRPQSALRQAITVAYRRDEAECLRPLIEAATVSPRLKESAARTAR